MPAGQLSASERSSSSINMHVLAFIQTKQFGCAHTQFGEGLATKQLRIALEPVNGRPFHSRLYATPQRDKCLLYDKRILLLILPQREGAQIVALAGLRTRDIAALGGLLDYAHGEPCHV